MPRTRVRTAGQESASFQAFVPWCSSCNGLIGGMVRGHGEANYFRDYKRLEAIAKLATSYQFALGTALGHREVRQDKCGELRFGELDGNWRRCKLWCRGAHDTMTSYEAG